MAQGFGVRELGKPEKVDADTRFMIASNTKALTTLMLAKLGSADVAAARLKICGRLMKKRWFVPSPGLEFRWSPPWGMKSM